MTQHLGTYEEFDALASRLMGRGMGALKLEDWGYLCIALEEAVQRRTPPELDAAPTPVALPPVEGGHGVR